MPRRVAIVVDDGSGFGRGGGGLIVATVVFAVRGRGHFVTGLPTATLFQYPRPGRGTFRRRHTFASATSEMPYFSASLISGVLHTSSYSCSRLTTTGCINAL